MKVWHTRCWWWRIRWNEAKTSKLSTPKEESHISIISIRQTHGLVINRRSKKETQKAIWCQWLSVSDPGLLRLDEEKNFRTIHNSNAASTDFKHWTYLTLFFLYNSYLIGRLWSAAEVSVERNGSRCWQKQTTSPGAGPYVVCRAPSQSPGLAPYTGAGQSPKSKGQVGKMLSGHLTKFGQVTLLLVMFLTIK